MPSPRRTSARRTSARHAAAGAFALATLAACGGTRPAAPLSGATPTGTRPVVGVPPFAARGEVEAPLDALPFALADLLATDLARARAVTVVERTRLDAVLREQGLVQAGRVDSATAPRLGRLVQADRIVLGQVTAFPDGRSIRLGVQVGDVARGTVVRTVDATATLEELLEAEKEIAFRTVDALGVVLTPAERAAIAARPTATLEALLAHGRGVRAELLGDWSEAARQYRRATALDGRFAAPRLRLREVRALQDAGTATPLFMPGLAPLGTATGIALDRLNRPLDVITALPRTGTAGEPSAPSSVATLIITVVRP
mgnify:FL=1